MRHLVENIEIVKSMYIRQFRCGGHSSFRIVALLEQCVHGGGSRHSWLSLGLRLIFAELGIVQCGGCGLYD